MEHSQKCLKLQKQYKERYDAYVAKYPNYCRTCHGEGALHYIENGAPHGCGFWAMPMMDPCPDCSGFGICPRCHAQTWPGDEECEKWPCPVCGWDWQRGDSCPDEFIDSPCECEQAEMDKMVEDYRASLSADAEITHLMYLDRESKDEPEG